MFSILVSLYLIGTCIYYYSKNKKVYTILFFVFFFIDLIRKLFLNNLIIEQLMVIRVIDIVQGVIFLTAFILYFMGLREKSKIAKEIK